MGSGSGPHPTPKRNREAAGATAGTSAVAGTRGKALERIRTADPFITSEVLYQLSYVGEASESRT